MRYQLSNLAGLALAGAFASCAADLLARHSSARVATVNTIMIIFLIVI